MVRHLGRTHGIGRGFGMTSQWIFAIIVTVVVLVGQHYMKKMT